MLYVVPSNAEYNTTSVTVEYFKDDALAVGAMDWEIVQPTETYTIDASDSVSLELDRHFPVRPAKVTVWNPGSDEALLLATLVGEELTTVLLQAPTLGFCALQLSLSKGNRLAIAELQAKSPSTPPALKRACQAMVREMLTAQALQVITGGEHDGDEAVPPAAEPPAGP